MHYMLFHNVKANNGTTTENTNARKLLPLLNKKIENVEVKEYCCENFLEQLECCFEKKIPDTWKLYGESYEGRKGIVRMEMKELMSVMETDDRQAMCEEILHLAGALFYLWKALDESDF